MTSIPTRPGVRQPFQLATPKAAPVATVILLPGDDGRLFALRENFLVRSQHMFVDEGFLVAILDTPSDRTSLARVSSDHARDVGTLIAALRAAAPVPVWLVGTSMGTISAVSVASQLDTGGPDGIVLASTVQQALNAGVDRVRVPTLVVHNKYDNCPVSPYSVGALALAVPTPRAVDVLERADHLLSLPGAVTARGYLGIEGDVVHANAEWIKAPR